MQRDKALQLLPEVYRCVLDWLDEGKDDADIAARLAVDPAAVAPLISVAHRKLDRVMEQDDNTTT
jgi:hypothetical protein